MNIKKTLVRKARDRDNIKELDKMALVVAIIIMVAASVGGGMYIDHSIR